MRDNKERNKKTGVNLSSQVNSTSLTESLLHIIFADECYVRAYLWFSKLGVRLTSSGSICMRSTQSSSEGSLALYGLRPSRLALAIALIWLAKSATSYQVRSSKLLPFGRTHLMYSWFFSMPPF